MTKSVSTLALLAALLLSACQTAATRAPVAADPSCGPTYVDSGYDDGLAGRPPRKLDCPAAERDAYAQGYSAGVYVLRYGQQSAIGPNAKSTRPIQGAQPAGGLAGGLARRSPDPSIPAGCTPAEARAAGRVGAPQPPACPDLGGVGEAYRQGRIEAQRSSQVMQLEREQNRLEYQLIKPSTSAGERRLIQSRIRTIERQKRSLPFK